MRNEKVLEILKEEGFVKVYPYNGNEDLTNCLYEDEVEELVEMYDGTLYKDSDGDIFTEKGIVDSYVEYMRYQLDEMESCESIDDADGSASIYYLSEYVDDFFTECFTN